MFVRKKKNRPGSTSVMVVDKSGSIFTEFKVIGVGTTDDEILRLVVQDKKWISHYGCQQAMSFPDEDVEQLKRKEDTITERIVSVVKILYNSIFTDY